MVTDIEMFECPDLSPVNFCLWCWLKREVDIRKVDTGDELLAPSLDAAAPREEKREHQLTRKTHDLDTRVANCDKDDGGIFEHLL
jgi:hypothetical protein